MHVLPSAELVSARHSALRREAEAEHLARSARRPGPSAVLSPTSAFALWMARLQAGLLR